MLPYMAYMDPMGYEFSKNFREILRPLVRDPATIPGTVKSSSRVVQQLSKTGPSGPSLLTISPPWLVKSNVKSMWKVF